MIECAEERLDLLSTHIVSDFRSNMYQLSHKKVMPYIFNTLEK
jgi:hypothetical protein